MILAFAGILLGSSYKLLTEVEGGGGVRQLCDEIDDEAVSLHSYLQTFHVKANLSRVQWVNGWRFRFSCVVRV